jgi:uncharacterized protein
MTISICNALEVTPQPWLNGGGQTRELLAWPSIENWQIRISLADIDTDGAFSAFPYAQRWFSVVEGHGVNLRFQEHNLIQTMQSKPLQFDGAQTPHCTLIDGPTRDLNLMLKNKSSAGGEIQIIRNANPWLSCCHVRAMLTTTSGIWINGIQSQRLKPYDFLWSVQHDALPWTFHADHQLDIENSCAWWLSANHSETTI